MKRIIYSFAAIGLLSATGVLQSCKKDNNSTNPVSPPVYTVPATYSFSNADSINSKTTLSMVAGMEGAINLANTSGKVVSGDQLQSMLLNQGNFFRDTAFSGFTISLNSSATSLNGIALPAARPLLQSVMDSVGIASASGLPASNGVAGVSDRKTLLSANGRYWRQFFTKLSMGVVIAHRITDVYLGDSLNSSISLAAKQHAWDQAFYLWCVPANFPANRTGVKYWGSYTSQIDSGILKPVTSLTGIDANNTLLTAFLTGRAALDNNDLTTALAQAAIIIPFFETMEAAAALHEINEARGNLVNGAAAVCGNLSESIGFWTALKYNTHRKISDADIQAVFDLYGVNFYNITPGGIDAILNKISSLYGWDAIKTNL